jgi:hypothetical protein
MKQIAALWLFLPLLACSPAPTAGDPATEGAAAPGPYAFDVQLTLTPRAADKLVSTRERIIVAGMFWGAPNAAAMPAADEMGQIPLGEDFLEVAPRSATVTVPAANFDPAQLPNVEGAPQVLVNVYSARKTHEDNLLACGIYEGPVAMAQKQAVDIQCDLIYDENGDPLPPPPQPA